MKKKEKQIHLEKIQRWGMQKMIECQSNIIACQKMIEQNEKMIKAVQNVLKKDEIELLTLQSEHQYEADVACEEYLKLSLNHHKNA